MLRFILKQIKRLAMFLKISKTLKFSKNNKIDFKKYTKSFSASVSCAQTVEGGSFKDTFLVRKYKEISSNMDSFFETISNSGLAGDINSKLNKLFYLLLVFSISGNSATMFSLILLCLISTKLYTILKKMLSHEKSKKLYFLMYIVAVSFILGQCLVLVTSNNSEVSEQGILLLYIYITATLMLFLIFLALTTCESYLYKESDVNDEMVFSKYWGSLTTSIILSSLAIFFYCGLVNDIVEVYNLKLNILFSNNSCKSFEESNCIDYANRYKIFYKTNESQNTWSVFDSLRFDIIDNYKNYLMSALLQTGTLLLVVLSLVI